LDGGENLDIKDLETFLTSPTPKNAGTVHCYVLRRARGALKLSPEYRLFMRAGKRFLLAAKKRVMKRTSNYMITMTQGDLVGSEAEKESIGKLRSNTWGTEFIVYDKGMNPTKIESAKSMGFSGRMPSGNPDQIRKELCAVTYAQNILGTKGPRKMKVAVPQVMRNGKTVVFQPTKAEDGLLKRAKNNDKNCFILINKPPRWNDLVGAYVLNFYGRVTMASVKNFQLVHPDDHDTVVLQFGRVGPNQFNMDYRYPLSPMQAFSVCLSSFDYKLACE